MLKPLLIGSRPSLPESLLDPAYPVDVAGKHLSDLQLRHPGFRKLQNQEITKEFGTVI
jgi:hypothetical protein